MGRALRRGRAVAVGIAVKILVTGASGFVGRHLVAALLKRGHAVTAVGRDRARLEPMPWREQVNFVTCDLHAAADSVPDQLGIPDALVHLAWPGLPNYRELFHFETNLPADYRFIKQMVEAGTRQVLITGTCFEYGMQNGLLTEDTPSLPDNPYGLAKDSLRLFLQALQSRRDFTLQWVRLFYLHGPGQNPNSVLAQLDRAIDAGDASFNMSSGEQLRDYLPIEDAAEDLAGLVAQKKFSGVVNCCSGRPISIRRLVEQRLVQRGARIELNLGHYPYPQHEPFAFWGSRQRLDQVLGRTS